MTANADGECTQCRMGFELNQLNQCLGVIGST